MKLLKQEKEFKHARALQKERNELWKQKNNSPSFKLDKPIQHGYVRDLEFRDDTKLHKDFDKIKLAVKLCGVQKMYHPNKDFKVKSTKKSIVEKHAHLNRLNDPRFQFFYSDEKQQEALNQIQECRKYLLHCDTFFVCDCSQCDGYWPILKDFRPHYKFKYPWMLIEVTKPHLLTHYTPVNSNLESRLAEIDEIFARKQYDKILFCNRHSWDKVWNEKINRLKYGVFDQNVILHSLDD